MSIKFDKKLTLVIAATAILGGCATMPKYSDTDVPKMEKQSTKPLRDLLTCNVKWMNEWRGVRQLPIEKGYVFIENEIGIAMRLTDEGAYRNIRFYHNNNPLSIRVFYTKDQFMEKALQCI